MKNNSHGRSILATGYRVVKWNKQNPSTYFWSLPLGGWTHWWKTRFAANPHPEAAFAFRRYRSLGAIFYPDAKALHHHAFGRTPLGWFTLRRAQQDRVCSARERAGPSAESIWPDSRRRYERPGADVPSIRRHEILLISKTHDSSYGRERATMENEPSFVEGRSEHSLPIKPYYPIPFFVAEMLLLAHVFLTIFR